MIEEPNVEVIDNKMHWKFRSGSWLRGYIDISYQELINKFGEPGTGDSYKTTAEWVLQIDGVIASIYNWKDGPTYRRGARIEDVRDWHIGGKDHQDGAVKAIKKVFPAHKVTTMDRDNPIHIAKTMVGA